MEKTKYLIFVLFVLGLILLGTQKVRAADTNYQDVVINEVMWMGSNDDFDDEWLELRNMTNSPINMLNWNITKKSGNAEVRMLTINSGIIIANGFYLISKKNTTTSILDIAPDIVTSEVSLVNNNLQIKLYKGDWADPDNLIDVADDGSGVPSGGSNTLPKKSMERNLIPGDGSQVSNWHTAIDSAGFKPATSEKGTPRSENSLIINEFPSAPILTAPFNNSDLLMGNEVEFSWLSSIDPEGQEISYEFYLGCSDSIGINDLIDSGFSETSYFLETNNILEDYGVCNKYYWQIVASDGFLRTESGIVYSFTIFEPVYPDEVLELINFQNAIIRHAQVSRIIDGDTIEVAGLEDFPSTIRLLFVNTPEENQIFYEEAKDFTGQLLNQSIDLLISRNPDEQIDNPIYNRTLAVIIFQNQVFNTQLLEQGLASFYDSTNSVLISDVWLAILQQAQQERIGLWESAGSIILSELLPDPVGSDADGEWVEIYNPSDERVVLSRFLLDRYLISSGAIIAPKSYQVFHRSQTGITLNNTGDTLKLFFPGGLLIDETSYGQSLEGLSWAQVADAWQWTTTITPNAANIIAVPKIEEDEEEEEEIPKNSEPLAIKTGDYKNFENYLVKVTGEVVETSGSTFWLDDGSGKAKIYIQAKTGIDKPEMHKGDIFEIIGIVNLYRESWRILPQKQDDIKLIKEAVKETADEQSKTAKSAKASSTTSKKSTASTTKARSPTTKKVASAGDQNYPFEIKAVKSPFWIEVAKSLTGLAIIFLGILIFRVLKMKKEKPLGGDFGDDLT